MGEHGSRGRAQPAAHSMWSSEREAKPEPQLGHGKPSEGGPQAPLQGREHHSRGPCVSIPALPRDIRQQLSSLIYKPHGLIGLE